MSSSNQNEADSRRPTVLTNTRHFASALLGCATLLGTPAALGAAPLLWYASRSPGAEANWLYGDDNCVHGSADCNRCVPDVMGQWDSLNDWDGGSWEFDWADQMAPNGARPESYWDDPEYHA